MSGNLTFSGAGIRQASNSSMFSILGSTSSWSAPLLVFYGYENTTSPGSFILRAGDGTNYKDLIGRPDGTLLWNGNRLSTMPNYGAGVAFTLNSTTSYTAPKDGFVFIYTGRAKDQSSNIKIDGTQVGSSVAYYTNIQYFFPVAKGTVVSTTIDTISSARFYPLKGAI
jgi:hypothetical protein